MSAAAPSPIERAVCVYCASSRSAHPDYRAAARRLGEVLAAEGVGIVYGGGAARGEAMFESPGKADHMDAELLSSASTCCVLRTRKQSISARQPCPRAEPRDKWA